MNLTCPYCNAFVPIQDSASIQKGARLPCPRCEETFTVEHIPTETKGFNPTTSEPTIPIRRPPNRKTALIVLGCMALMACVGLAYMVVSEKQRRKNDTGIVRKDSGRKDIRNNPKAEKVTPKAPLELEAIRYLPSDTQLVIGAHTAELLQMSEGKALLKKGIQFEQFRTVVQKVESLLALKLEQIDHFVIGVRSIDTKLFPPIHIVVRAKTAFDQEQIKKQLSTRPIVSKKKPTVHTFTHEILTTYINGQLTFPTPKVAVLGWKINSKDTSTMRTRAPEGSHYLSKPLTKMLTESVQKPAPFWIVAHSPDWKKALNTMFVFLKVDKQYRNLLPHFQTLGLWVQKDISPVARGLIHCPNEDSAEALMATLPDLTTLDKKQLKLVRNANSLTLQYRFSPELFK